MKNEMIERRVWFVDMDGERRFPVRQMNRDTGRIQFRVSRGGVRGNTKEKTIFVDRIEDALPLVFVDGCLIRARKAETGSSSNLVGLNKRAIVGWDAAPEMKVVIQALISG